MRIAWKFRLVRRNLATKTRHGLVIVFEMWTRLLFDVETFIEAVKERPALYNSKHENYNRKDVRARLWDEIGQIIYPEWGSFDSKDKNEKGSMMQRKWKSLKDCFNREIRLQKIRNTNKVRKKYEFYDKLSFLLLKENPESIKFPEAVKEAGIKEVKLESPESDARTLTQSSHQSFRQSVSDENRTEIPSPETNSRKRKAKSEEEFLERLKQKYKKKRKGEEDSDRLFLMSFLNDLKKLPLVTKYWVKMKFSEIMHQAAMSLDGYQDAEYGSTSMEPEQEIGSSETGYPVDELEEGSSPDSSSCEIYDNCQE